MKEDALFFIPSSLILHPSFPPSGELTKSARVSDATGL
jgi:hypothetical protein